MVNFKKALGGISVVVSVLAGAAGADASCAVQGKVRQVYSVSEAADTYSSKGYTYVILAPLEGFLSSSGIFYYGYSYNEKFTTTVAAAQSNNATATVIGDASNCPVSGTSRYVGQISLVYTATNY